MRVRPLASAGAGLILLAACTSSTPNATPAGPILQIGVDLPLTGAAAPAAVPALNGIRFYVDKHPTISGFQVQLKTTDDARGGKPSPELGAANVQSFVATSNLVAMLGPFDASVARREIPIANTAGLAMVTPATSSPCLTKDVFIPALLNPAYTKISCRMAGLAPASELRPKPQNNFFRLTTTDELQGAAAADYAYGRFHVLRAAVISDHEAYGQGLVDAFSARLQRLGGTVVGHLDIDPRLPDATAFLKAAKAGGAQAVYFGGVAGDHDCTIRAQMKSVFDGGEATPFLAGDGIAQDPGCVTDAADNALGMYATVPIVDADSSLVAADTIRAFRAAYGNVRDYGPYTLIAYDATAILYSAIRRAIAADAGKLPARADVIAQLVATTGYPGVTGFIGFDALGDTTNRQISMFEATGSDPRAPWRLAATIDYSSGLPY
jgi:branched-chain amino acid transport system substrate-binding protein